MADTSGIEAAHRPGYAVCVMTCAPVGQVPLLLAPSQQSYLRWALGWDAVWDAGWDGLKDEMTGE